MKPRPITITFCYLFVQIQEILGAYNVTDLVLKPCNTKNNYSITIDNVTVDVVTKRIIHVTGSLNTETDLIAPIKALVWLKRDIWGIWIPIPCEDNVGSCTYDDLCSFGIPLNETCPEKFLDSNVPCRCPIPKGNYTILPSIQLAENLHHKSIVSGDYYATVKITQGPLMLSCYNAQFKLSDSSIDGIEPSVILV